MNPILVALVVTAAQAEPASVPSPVLADSSQIAQTFYPSADAEQQSIMVIGQGRANVPADIATINLSLLNYDPYSYYDPSLYDPYAVEEGVEPIEPEPSEDLTPLTRQTLQPLVDLLVEQGVAEDAIDLTLSGNYAQGYTDGQDNATITFTLPQPTRQRVDAIVTALEELPQDEVFLENVSVVYAVDDCTALEQQVYVSAIDDARSRATAMAGAMGVELDGMPSVAESPFNLLNPPCNAESGSFFPFGPDPTSIYYDPLRPAEVRMSREVFVTFPVR